MRERRDSAGLDASEGAILDRFQRSTLTRPSTQGAVTEAASLFALLRDVHRPGWWPDEPRIDCHRSTLTHIPGPAVGIW